MPPAPKGTQDSTTMPEVQGLKYDESRMTLFHAKLAYHATIEERLASKDNHLISLSESQARLLKRWEMLKQAEEELADRGEKLTPFDERQLAQYAWRYNELEKVASQKAAR